MRLRPASRSSRQRSSCPLRQAAWGLVLLLSVAAAAKSGLAFASGGRSYGLRVTLGLATMPLGAGLTLMLLSVAR